MDWRKLPMISQYNSTIKYKLLYKKLPKSLAKTWAHIGMLSWVSVRYSLKVMSKICFRKYASKLLECTVNTVHHLPGGPGTITPWHVWPALWHHLTPWTGHPWCYQQPPSSSPPGTITPRAAVVICRSGLSGRALWSFAPPQSPHCMQMSDIPRSTEWQNFM